MKAPLLLALTVLLSACGAARQAAFTDAMTALTQERQACAAAHPQMAKGSASANAACELAAENRLLRPVHPAPDLLDLLQAKRGLLTAQFDRGEISREGAIYEMAQVRSQVTGELQRRNLARRSVAAQEAASGPQTCMRVGNSVMCY